MLDMLSTAPAVWILSSSILSSALTVWIVRAHYRSAANRHYHRGWQAGRQFPDTDH